MLNHELLKAFDVFSTEQALDELVLLEDAKKLLQHGDMIVSSLQCQHEDHGDSNKVFRIFHAMENNRGF